MQRGLRVIKGPADISRIFLLNDGKEICGRAEGCSILLIGEKISRKHCEFLTDNLGISVRDLDSSNGVFINGERKKESNLQIGDRVQIGEFLLEVVNAKDKNS